MALIDLVDDTFVAADPAAVAAVVADERRWARWWPDLALTTTRDRGPKGRQWRVDGALVGTAEVWLEPWGDGVLVHCFLRLDPAPAPAPGEGPAAWRWAARERAARAQAWKRVVHGLKDDLEHGRRPGTPVPALKAPAGAADHRGDES
ncbi:hypothetical protein GCM10027446_23980 [Angustibacter peucedani]